MALTLLCSPFVFNTVGRDNYKWFVGLLAVHPFAYLFFVVTTVYFWRRASFSWLFVLFLFYSLGMCLMVLGLLNYHCKLLSNNLTTNEDINMTRYQYMRNEFNVLHNPFDRGSSWANVSDGLFPSGAEYFSREDALRDSGGGRSGSRGGGGHSHSHNHHGHCNHHGAGSGADEHEGFFEEAKVKLLQ